MREEVGQRLPALGARGEKREGDRRERKRERERKGGRERALRKIGVEKGTGRL